VTVIFLPDYTDGNPYQANLADALDEEVAFAGDGKFFPILRAVRSNEDVSVVHFHWLHAYIFVESSALKTLAQLILTVLQLLVLRLHNISMVWSVHNVMSHESPYPSLERWFRHAFIRFGFCDALFIHCKAVEDSIIEEYNLSEDVREQVQLIPHGHYLNNYENEISQEEARSELGIKRDETVFLYFGRIRPYKGVSYLMDVFSYIEASNSRLLIVGSPTNESIKNIVQKKSAGDDRITTVLDYVPDEDIQYYMNASDCVVLPFNEITTSGSAVLAMSFSKAIIIPERGCVPEQLDEEGSLIYPPDSEDGLRTALTEALNRDLMSMGKYNEQLVRQYDWEDIAETTTQVYSRLK
jgi:glycosyltransferase involved in cell wall biosynthesis